jgi:gamma-glutamyltranspeptidase/glutathione hydrolase
MRITLLKQYYLIFFIGIALAFPAYAVDVPSIGSERTLAIANKEMVAAGDKRAAAIGLEILRKGGNAVDAAIATQLVLNLVEPQSSGIGGGSFMMFWDQKNSKMTALDGREKAPSAATPERFLKADGKPMDWKDAYPGGLSVGVPGTVKLLETAHQKWGHLPWKDLFAPAIKLAEEGYEISPRLNTALTTEADTLTKSPIAKALYYTEDGKPKTAGTVIKNPAFAQTLRTIAEKGSAGFYSGPIAEDIIATVTQSPINAGDMTLADLKAYTVKERETVCEPYRAYKVCGFGPPTSGGITVAQILGILQTKDMAPLKGNAKAAHFFSEAGDLAYADRNLYIADTDFVDVPVKSMIESGYLQSRAKLINDDKVFDIAQAGNPGRQSYNFVPSAGIEYGTSHMSIIDKNGNAVSMTTTIEYRFGSQLMTKGGFSLNNQLTDFSLNPKEGDKLVANRVEANKRPRSSVSPTLVFDKNGKLFAIVGSPGGPQIINFVAEALVGLIDWNMNPQQIANLGHYGSRNNGVIELEQNTDAVGYKADLEKMGHQTKVMEIKSGLNILQIKDRRILGGSDPRQEGAALGD